MAIMPGVEYRPISYAGVPAMQRYDVVCVHTIVGRAPANAAHFSTDGNGHIWQSRDTRYQSVANLNGNHRVIAIENADHGPGFPAWNVNDGHAVPAFTSAQCESIARICAWAHRTHGIPMVLCPDSRPGSRGIGYHRQGCDGNYAGYAFSGRISGGELWSRAGGKVCPGDRRIRQVNDVIIPRARVLAGSEPVSKEDDMAQADVDAIVAWLRPIYQQLTGSTEIGKYAGWPQVPGLAGHTGPMTLVDYFRAVRAVQARDAQQIAGLTAAVSTLSQAVANDVDVTAEELRQAVREALAEAVLPPERQP